MVFNAFVQADSSTTKKYGGSGLGIALCKQYCELIGGAITVNSSVETGTPFTVEFTANLYVENPSISFRQNNQTRKSKDLDYQ